MSELFLKLLNMSITASWLIVAVVLLRLVLKRAPKWINCVLWALVAVRLICPFSFESRLSLVPDTDVNGAVDAVVSQMVESEMQDAIEQLGGADGAMVTFEAEIPAVIVPNGGSATSDDVISFGVADIAAAIWLAGVAILLLHALISYLRLRRRVAAAMPLGNKVWLCDAVESPFILGFFRPRIYLPSAIDEGDMEHVLAHERAHLQRRDHWWKPLGYVLLAVYWFNPLIWLAYILLCRDIELACDEKVINRPETDRKSYSEALLACSVKRAAITACPLAFGEVSVRGRIKSVLNYKKPAFWIILVALVACVVLAVCFLTNPLKPTKENVLKQNGYEITQIETDVTMVVTIPLEVLPDDPYVYAVHEPYTYEEEEVVLWENDSTTMWLESVGYEEGNGYLVFDCEFSYEIQDRGTIRTLGWPKIENGVTISMQTTDGVGSRGVYDSNLFYSNAAYLRGSNWGRQFSMALDAEVVEQASDYVAFQASCLNDISYQKGSANHEDDIEVSASDRNTILLSESARYTALQRGREIALQFGNVPSDYWAYHNSEIDDMIGVWEYIQIKEQLDLNMGDKVPNYFLSSDRKTLIAVKEDQDENYYSWTFVKNETGEWEMSDSQTKPTNSSVSNAGGTDEPAVILVTSEVDDTNPALEAAKDYVAERMETFNEGWKEIAPGNSTTIGKVTALESVASVAMENIRLDLYRLEYRMLLDGNVDAVLVGGMSHEEIDGEVWLTEWESSGQPYILHYSEIMEDGQIEWKTICMTSTEEIGMIYAENKDMETQLGLDKYTIAAQKLYEKYLEENAVHTQVDYSILNGNAEFYNQPLEITEDPMNYQERLDWVKSGEVYTEILENGGQTPYKSLGQWQEGDGCLAYVWQPYGSPHPGVSFLAIRFKDGTQARLPLPDEQTNRTAKPTSMVFRDGKFFYDVQFESTLQEYENGITAILKGMYHYELDLTNKTLSLSLGQTEGTANSTVADAMVAAVETLLAKNLPATISMTMTSRFYPVYYRVGPPVFDAWNSINGKSSCSGILNHTYQEVDSLETSDTLITLEFTVNGVDWGLTFYDGTDSLSVCTGGAEYYFKAIPNYEDIFLSPLGSLIRRWYDEAEFMAMDGYDGKTIVIPNTGQSYLEAAQAWCEAYEGLHLKASSGSKEFYTYVSCRVEAAEGATEMYRERGEIGENTYAFFAYTAFVPENEQALQWSMAGNTGAYEGDDPNVPKEAYEYTRCGYITLEEDGWHGVIVGTGF